MLFSLFSIVFLVYLLFNFAYIFRKGCPVCVFTVCKGWVCVVCLFPWSFSYSYVYFFFVIWLFYSDLLYYIVFDVLACHKANWKWGSNSSHTLEWQIRLLNVFHHRHKSLRLSGSITFLGVKWLKRNSSLPTTSCFFHTHTFHNFPFNIIHLP